MVDQIDVICKRLKFDKIIEEKETDIIEMVAHLFEAYEIYYGKSNPPPIDVIKRAIRLIIEVSPEATILMVKYSRLVDKVLDRVVEKIYFSAEKQLEEMGYITYI